MSHFVLLLPLQQITPFLVILLHDNPFKNHLQTFYIKKNYIKNIPKVLLVMTPFIRTPQRVSENCLLVMTVYKPPSHLQV